MVLGHCENILLPYTFHLKVLAAIGDVCSNQLFLCGLPNSDFLIFAALLHILAAIL